MGWSFCGYDSEGRPIGYSVKAVCDYPGCNKEIYRGLSYACGGEHGGGEYFCERYFCYEHLIHSDYPNGESGFVCPECEKKNLSKLPVCSGCGETSVNEGDGWFCENSFCPYNDESADFDPY